MVVDALGPAVQVNKPVDSCQLGPEQLLPLGVDHGVNAADVIDGDHAVGGGGWKGNKIRFRSEFLMEGHFIDINVYNKTRYYM